jgi:glyoxylase-like metal-dependent hydrolase (beta-lactamase superfamily II)
MPSEDTGPAQAEIRVGVAVQLAPAVRRLTAPNPGLMTGPGTNSYLLGRDRGAASDYVVLDPGPAIEAHLQALLAAAGGRVAAILVTHTHRDHSPGAARLAALTGAPCIGLPPPAQSGHPGGQDLSFVPQHQPADAEVIERAGLRLQAVHTPGHASNHVCWWLEEACMLFTGDHLMQGSTVVIDPPDGDMAAYLASLRALPARLPALEWLAPGHGVLMDQPVQAINRLLLHRQRREDKVLAALHDTDHRPISALLPAVYEDVPPHLHPAAQRSLLAHLLKLQQEGRADQTVGGWRLRPCAP